MSNRDAELDRRKRRGHGRIDITDDDESIEPPSASRAFFEHRFHPLEHPGCLHTVACRPDVERDIRPPHVEFIEEDVRQARVVMLAGMDERCAEPIAIGRLAERAKDRRHLHKIRPSADNTGEVGSCQGGIAFSLLIY